MSPVYAVVEVYDIHRTAVHSSHVNCEVIESILLELYI